MSTDEPSRSARPPLAHQPDWGRRHAQIMSVEPFKSLSKPERDAFLTAIATVSEEEDLTAEHRRWLHEARPELERRQAGKAKERKRAENGDS